MNEEPEHERSSPTWSVVLRAIVVVGVLAALVVPMVTQKSFPHCGWPSTRSDIAVLAQAIREFTSIEGHPPESLAALVTSDENDFKFIDRETLPKDPWGNEYLYEPPRAGQLFRVYSYGADGAPGGEEKDSDIENEIVNDGCDAPPGHEQE